MTDHKKAVFLSYASEDTAAAQAICNALRNAGIEVWFDQSELRGGDAWDGEIRRQIRACALFIPIISRNTHARGEGYFRLEWKLAVDRSHLMANNQPFLVPVVIDDTPNSEGRVPERFSEVQWTRLTNGEVPAAFIERINRLLTSPLTSHELKAPPPSRTTSVSRPKILWALVGVAVIACVIVVVDRSTLRTSTVAAPPPAAQTAAPPANSIPENSIAVLPFADVSQQKDQEYFSNGLSEELINQLSRIPSLRVPARRSSFFFKGKSDDIASIAQRLRVAHVLEGSVRKNGNRLRCTAELIRADNGYHLWSETYDIELKDIFKVQDQIASAVVTALKMRLALLGPTAAQRTSNPEAYNQYLLARQFYLGGTAENYRHAMEALRKAIALDPNYAAAHVDLGLVGFNLGDMMGDAAEIKRAFETVDKGIALRPDDADGYSARGFMRTNSSWDWAGARADFLKGIEIDPSNAEVQDNYGQLLQSLGQLPEAIAAARKATELDPLSGPAWENLARFLTDNHDYAAARAANAHALEFSPEGTYALNNLGTLQLLEGNAADALRSFRQVGFEGFRLQGIAMAEFSLGNSKESQQALDDLSTKYAHDGPYEIADVYAWRGEKEKAFQWLERAYGQHDGGMANIKSDPLLASLRGDERYADFLRRMNLPP